MKIRETIIKNNEFRNEALYMALFQKMNLNKVKFNVSNIT